MDESIVACGNCDKGMVRDKYETWVVCPLCKGWRYYSVRPTPKAKDFNPRDAQKWMFDRPEDKTEIDYLNGIVRD